MNGTWCMAHNACNIMHGSCCIVHDAGCIMHCTWSMRHGDHNMVHDTWCESHGASSTVHVWHGMRDMAVVAWCTSFHTYAISHAACAKVWQLAHICHITCVHVTYTNVWHIRCIDCGTRDRVLVLLLYAICCTKGGACMWNMFINTCKRIYHKVGMLCVSVHFRKYFLFLYPPLQTVSGNH